MFYFINAFFDPLIALNVTKSYSNVSVIYFKFFIFVLANKNVHNIYDIIKFINRKYYSKFNFNLKFYLSLKII